MQSHNQEKTSNRKVYFQNSILIYSILLLFLFIAASSIYVIVYFFSTFNIQFYTIEWVYIIVASCTFIYSLYTTIRVARNRIILDIKEIYVPENWGNKKSILQLETHIPYGKIKNISLIKSKNNSLGQKVKMAFVDMPYIVFECVDDKNYLINVYYYSKKQVVDIINECINRADLIGNRLTIGTGEEILQKFCERK